MGKTSSALIPMFISEIMKMPEKRPFYVAEGSNTRSWVHMKDLMRIYLHLVESAAAGGNGATWNEEGYYFASTQEVSHLTLATALGKVLKKHGVIENAEPLKIGVERLDKMVMQYGWPMLARYLFASNSRTRAERAGKLWGYEGKEGGLLEELEGDVLVEIAG